MGLRDYLDESGHDFAGDVEFYFDIDIKFEGATPQERKEWLQKSLKKAFPSENVVVDFSRIYFDIENDDYDSDRVTPFTALLANESGVASVGDAAMVKTMVRWMAKNSSSRNSYRLRFFNVNSVNILSYVGSFAPMIEGLAEWFKDSQAAFEEYLDNDSALEKAATTIDSELQFGLTDNPSMSGFQLPGVPGKCYLLGRDPLDYMSYDNSGAVLEVIGGEFRSTTIDNVLSGVQRASSTENKQGIIRAYRDLPRLVKATFRPTDPRNFINFATMDGDTRTQLKSAKQKLNGDSDEDEDGQIDQKLSEAYGLVLKDYLAPKTDVILPPLDESVERVMKLNKLLGGG